MMLIAGGAGFLGRNIVETALAAGQAVTVSSRDPELASSRFEADVLASPLVELVQTQALIGGLQDDRIRKARTVIILLGGGGPSRDEASLAAQIEAAVLPSVRLIDRCAAVNPKARIVLMSSGGTVYGPDHSSPAPESAPCNPASLYGMAKLQTETALRLVGEARGQPYAILRVANPVGRWRSDPRQGFAEVAVSAIRSGRPVTVYGDGLIVRDYFAATELAQLCLTLHQRPDWVSGTWNIGSGVGRTQLDIVRLAELAVRQHAEVHHAPARAFDLRYAVVDPARAGA
jgi:UDP-glucose 4-epimerase